MGCVSLRSPGVQDFAPNFNQEDSKRKGMSFCTSFTSVPMPLEAVQIQAWATVALSVTTGALVAATVALWKATQSLARIESKRDLRNRIERKIGLGNLILDGDAQAFIGSFTQRFTRPEGGYIRELDMLLDYEEDKVSRDDVDELLEALDEVRRLELPDAVRLDEIRSSYWNLRQALREVIPLWRGQLHSGLY